VEHGAEWKRHALYKFRSVETLQYAISKGFTMDSHLCTEIAEAGLYFIII